MRWLRRLIGIAFFVAALVVGWTFARRNGAPIAVDYLAGSLEGPGWLVLLGAVGVGGAVATLFLGFQAARLALVARRYRKLAAGFEEEVHQLRNLPLVAPEEATRIGSKDRARSASGPEDPVRAAALGVPGRSG